MRFVFDALAVCFVGIGSGCKSDVKYYCDDTTPCLPRYPDRPFCDLTGEYEPDGIRNTCVPNPYDGGPDAGPDGPDGGADIDGALLDGQSADGSGLPDPIVEDIAHVPLAAETAGVADVAIIGTVVVNTTNLTFDGGAPPTGATFDLSAQETGTGPQLAILHLRSLTVQAGATLRAVGGRPLVIIASRSVTINGVIDASADRNTAGAGGSIPGVGVGAGGTSTNSIANDEPGGGGAGFGPAGAAGGPGVGGSAGAGGSTFGDSAQTLLFGGSGGGTSAVCPADPAGAGGGAVQIYSAAVISIASGGRH